MQFSSFVMSWFWEKYTTPTNESWAIKLEEKTVNFTHVILTCLDEHPFPLHYVLVLVATISRIPLEGRGSNICWHNKSLSSGPQWSVPIPSSSKWGLLQDRPPASKDAFVCPKIPPLLRIYSLKQSAQVESPLLRRIKDVKIGISNFPAALLAVSRYNAEGWRNTAQSCISLPSANSHHTIIKFELVRLLFLSCLRRPQRMWACYPPNLSHSRTKPAT